MRTALLFLFVATNALKPLTQTRTAPHPALAYPLNALRTNHTPTAPKKHTTPLWTSHTPHTQQRSFRNTPLFTALWCTIASAATLYCTVACIAATWTRWPQAIFADAEKRDKLQKPCRRWHKLALACFGLAVHGPPSPDIIAPSKSWERLPMFQKSMSFGTSVGSQGGPGDFGV